MRRLPVLFFLAGAMAALLIYLKVLAHREDRLLDALKRQVDAVAGNNASPTAVVLAAMNVTHEVISEKIILTGTGGASIGDWMPCSLANQLLGEGACGSYSIVLARLLDSYNYPVRIGQMKTKGHFGGHIIVEARVARDWVVLDPLYDLAFRRPDSSLASFTDLHDRWRDYTSQLPPSYDTNYCYEGMRYTNWNKIPLIMPATHKLLSLTLGEQRTADVCLRIHLLRVYEICFYLDLSVLVVLSVYLYCGVRGLMPWQKTALQSMTDK